MNALKILHIEDDAIARDSVRDILALHGMHCTSTDFGREGIRLAASNAFDLAVIDRSLLDMDGIEIVRRLRDAGSALPVLMLSALGLSSNRIEGLDAGADDYLAKPFEPDELVARIKALHRRTHATGHAPTLICGGLECHLKARTAWRDGIHIPLSPREFDMFRYFMENAGDLVTRDMLLQNVWKLSFDPQTNVIDVNVARLRRKLEDGFEQPILETVRGAGYRLIGYPT